MITLSFVIPLYNEEKRLSKAFEALYELVLPAGLKLEEIIFVNDGSTDKTVERIKYYVSSINKNKKYILHNTSYKIQIISYEKNMGKGYAIRQGMLASNSDYTLFFDADISTPLSEIAKFVPLMEQNVHVIVGTRKNGKSTVITHQPLYREILGRAFTQITQIALHVSVSDFTCGFKAFRKIAKDVIFAKSQINGWSYDAEILFLAKKNGATIAEVPVAWSNVTDSKVKLYKAIPQTLKDIALIRLYDVVEIIPSVLVSLRITLSSKQLMTKFFSFLA